MCVCPKISFAAGLRLLFVATVFVFSNFGPSVCEIRGQVWEQRPAQAPRPQVALLNFFLPDKNVQVAPDSRANQIVPVVNGGASLPTWNAPENPTAGHAVAHYVKPAAYPAVDKTLMRMAHGVTDNNVAQYVPPSANQIVHTSEVVPVGGSQVLEQGQAQAPRPPVAHPNYLLRNRTASVDPYPRTNQLAPVANHDTALPNWDAPENPTAGHAVAQYANPAVDQSLISMAHGVTDNNVVQYVTPSANQIVHTSEVVSQEVVSEVVPVGDSYFEASAIQGHTAFEQVSLELPPVPQILTQPINRNSALLSAYQSRSTLQPSEEFQATQSSKLPRGFQPWWSQENQSPMGLKDSPVSVSLDSLIQRALTNSPHIQVAATQPHIQQAVLLEESSRFDWMSFLESTYDDQNDPVGNTLTTGNNDSRFQQQEWYAEGGLRRQTRTGGEVELSQRISTLQNNSQFLFPEDQGNSRLVLNYRQPLLRGRGRAVNESLIVLANINLDAASDELLNKIQQHLTDLTETYWELVRARSELLQRSKLLIGAEKILTQLEGRAEVDALDRQVFRARSAVAKRKAEIARSVTSVKNAESRIRLLVNDREIISAASMELVPVDMPNLEYLGISLGDAISTALANRPDISRSIREIKATSVQLGISRNDLLPKLDLLVGSYVAGLDAEFDILGATGNQFADGRPGFNIGFEFEAPIGNRAAQARQSRRTWEANRAMHQFRAVVESGLTEVELAVREVQTAHQEMNGRYHAMVAAQKESSFLSDRWETLPDENDSVVLLLENLLDSQERLVNEESAFAKAQFEYSVAVVKLKQATGILFQVN